MARQIAPVSPGEILLEEFLIPLGISQNKLAKDIGVSVSRISDIIRKNRTITAETAIRLGVYFNTTPKFWVNLQSNYDLKTAKDSFDGKVLVRIERKRAAFA